MAKVPLARKLAASLRRGRPGATTARPADAAEDCVVSCETGLSCLFRLGVQNAVYADIGAVRRRNLVDGPNLPVPRLAALGAEFGLQAERARLDWRR